MRKVINFSMLVLMIIFLSCKNWISNEPNQGNLKDSYNLISDLQDLGKYDFKKKDSINFQIPDTTYLNRQISSELSFKSQFDSIPSSSNVDKYKLLYVCIDSIFKKDLNDIENIDHEIFTQDDSLGVIKFWYQFTDVQKNHLTVLLEDTVIIDNYNETGKSRIIVDYYNIQKKVVVIDTSTSRSSLTRANNQ